MVTWNQQGTVSPTCRTNFNATLPITSLKLTNIELSLYRFVLRKCTINNEYRDKTVFVLYIILVVLLCVCVPENFGQQPKSPPQGQQS